MGIRRLAVGVVLACLSSSVGASPSSDLERQISQIFVNRSFTIRNFYRGDRLSYDSMGALLSKAEPGYWSRDGMVLISSVKIPTEGRLVIRGDRYCVEFDPESGEFDNVRTGDHIEISIQLAQNDLSLEAGVRVLQKIFVTASEKLSDIAPPYWADCLSHQVSRRSKDALWECEAADKKKVPSVAGKKLEWNIPPPDTSLHNGMQLYLLEHRVAYIPEEGATLPKLQVSPDPVLRWEQRRVRLGQLTCVLSLVIGEDGKPSDVSIVTPVGMGLDDDAATALQQWRFTPGKRDGKPVPLHARIAFLVTTPNTRPTFPLMPY